MYEIKAEFTDTAATAAAVAPRHPKSCCEMVAKQRAKRKPFHFLDDSLCNYNE